MKCERNQHLIILVVCLKNDEKLRSPNLSVVTPKLEASVYEKNAENRKSSAERDGQPIYVIQMHILYIENTDHVDFLHVCISPWMPLRRISYGDDKHGRKPPQRSVSASPRWMSSLTVM